MMSKTYDPEIISEVLRDGDRCIVLPRSLDEAVFHSLMPQILRYTSDLRFSSKARSSALYYFANTIASKDEWKKSSVNTAVLASISLAAKTHETFGLNLNDLIMDCGYKGRVEDIINMEELILTTLRWKINPITPCDVVGILVQEMPARTQKKCREISKMADNIVGLCLTESDFRGASCLIIALASFVCALEKYRCFSDRDAVIKSMMEYFPVNYEELLRCRECIYTIISEDDPDYISKIGVDELRSFELLYVAKLSHRPSSQDENETTCSELLEENSSPTLNKFYSMESLGSSKALPSIEIEDFAPA